ncbi:MAG: nitroreductase family protein [Candidatus Aminicenantes bacterium]|nr:nitroreductase family protein [Candidatus Aminicenantes bacterium]
MKKNTIGHLQPIELPAPAFSRCRTVFEALKARRTCRLYKDRKVRVQVLSDLLWAAQGINRKRGPFGGPGRTAGSASNSQEIRIYVALEEGIYLYEPEAHRMNPISMGDHRALAIGPGQGRAGANAPVRLIYVVDKDKFKSAGFQEPGLHDREIQKSYYFVDTGLIAQNVYLAAASLGLASWFHNCNKAALEKLLDLKPGRRALFGQTIGFPAE